MAQAYVYEDDSTGWRHLANGDLPASGVTNGTYGDASHVGQFTVNAEGIVTSASNVAISGGGSGTISDITSTGSTITVTSPTGPTTNVDLPASGVTATSYGDASHVGQFTVNAKGIVTSASSIAIGPSIPGGAWTTLTKPSDTSIASNTTIALDGDLQFTSTSGAMYWFQSIFTYASPAGAGAPDMKFTFAEDGTSRGLWVILAFFNTADTASSIPANAIGVNTAATGAIGTAATNRLGICQGWYLGNGGSFGLWWSQNTSSVNATIVRSGSTLSYTRMN